ncbi:hypothetical protein LTR95_001085 [Oleoguttula sp. CCFEE 5521]
MAAEGLGLMTKEGMDMDRLSDGVVCRSLRAHVNHSYHSHLDSASHLPQSRDYYLYESADSLTTIMVVLETTVLAAAALYLAMYRAISKHSHVSSMAYTGTSRSAKEDLEIAQFTAKGCKQDQEAETRRASGKIVLKPRRNSAVAEQQSPETDLRGTPDTVVIEGRRDLKVDEEQAKTLWAEVVEDERELQRRAREYEKRVERHEREKLIRALWEIRQRVSRVPAEVEAMK